ncbi:hypothetical protein NEAUS03_0509 [Nematocida ausubeli]|nr:hypothetical protein NEAUS03_0509 [Nematocida ausubeli]
MQRHAKFYILIKAVYTQRNTMHIYFTNSIYSRSIYKKANHHLFLCFMQFSLCLACSIIYNCLILLEYIVYIYVRKPIMQLHSGFLFIEGYTGFIKICSVSSHKSHVPSLEISWMKFVFTILLCGLYSYP